ncbi:MAG: metalloregulator ArsR/SmtB family transcription factor [Desulfobacteraceae bacterium]|nr:metalloregulator ArsR/SmtB family transcription factor [Desulfobacteraceae bacterium]
MDEKKTDICEEFCFDRSSVNYVQERMLDEKELELMTEIFKALGDRTRSKILHALAQKELCVCDLSVALNMSTSAVSHQLRILKGARLVKYRREGKNIYYSMDDEHITLLFQQALEHVRHN